MVATTAAQTSPQHSGLRPVRPRRDLAAIADLIEVSFADTLDTGGRSMLREMRMMAHANPLIWLVARLGGAFPPLGGYVWVADGQVAGNVSIAPAGYGKGFVIANVAVYPAFRRQGIARQLMRAALQDVAQRGRFAVLQVDADNHAARRLYDTLGFHTQRTFTRWRRAGSPRAPLPPGAPLPGLRRLQRDDRAALVALAERLRPDSRGGMGWLRPTTARGLRPPLLPGLDILLGGKRVEYWVLPGASGGLDAALCVEHRIGGLTMAFDLLVQPERQGELEAPLLYHLLRLYGHRPLLTDHPSDDPAIGDIIQRYRFRPERALVHMIWTVPSET